MSTAQAPPRVKRNRSTRPAGNGPAKSGRFRRAVDSVVRFLVQAWHWVRRAVGPVTIALTPVARVVWKYVGPFLKPVSKIGWVVFCAAVTSWIVGLSLNWWEITLIAIICTVVLLVAIGFILGRSAYKVELDLTSRRVVVGERAVGKVRVSNAASKSLLPARIELAVGRAMASFNLPRLEPEQVHEELFAVPTKKRAVLIVGPVRSVRDDPLSLMRRVVVWTEPSELYVHPRTVSLGDSASGYLRDLEGVPSAELSSSDIAFHALRDYTPGDDRRHVHWKTTARIGKIMVRQFEETRRSHIVVALSTAAQDYAGDAEFELAVSAAASLARQTMREEKELTALTSERQVRTTHFRQMMDDFTVIEPSQERILMHDLGRKATESAPGASAVIFVVGSKATPADLNAAATQLPSGILALAVRCVDGAKVTRAAIADLDIVTLGELEELPKAMRAVA